MRRKSFTQKAARRGAVGAHPWRCPRPRMGLCAPGLRDVPLPYRTGWAAIPIPSPRSSTGAEGNPLRAPPFPSQPRPRSPGGQKQPQPRPRLPPWARPRRRRSRLRGLPAAAGEEQEESGRRPGTRCTRSSGSATKGSTAPRRRRRGECLRSGPESSAPRPRLASAGGPTPAGAAACGAAPSASTPGCGHPNGVKHPRVGVAASADAATFPQHKVWASRSAGTPRCEHPPVPSPGHGMAFLGRTRPSLPRRCGQLPSPSRCVPGEIPGQKLDQKSLQALLVFSKDRLSPLFSFFFPQPYWCESVLRLSWL